VIVDKIFNREIKISKKFMFNKEINVYNIARAGNDDYPPVEGAAILERLKEKCFYDDEDQRVEAKKFYDFMIRSGLSYKAIEDFIGIF